MMLTNVFSNITVFHYTHYLIGDFHCIVYLIVSSYYIITFLLCSDLVYSPPENAVTSSYCMETFCYVSGTNLSVCNSDYCEMETRVPSIPDIDNNHWFFDNFLYTGGAIHLVMSLAMTVSYFLINAANFVLPGFVYEHIYVNLKYVY